jgi:hypothetical protein
MSELILCSVPEASESLADRVTFSKATTERRTSTNPQCKRLRSTRQQHPVEGAALNARHQDGAPLICMLPRSANNDRALCSAARARDQVFVLRAERRESRSKREAGRVSIVRDMPLRVEREMHQCDVVTRTLEVIDPAPQSADHAVAREITARVGHFKKRVTASGQLQ